MTPAQALTAVYGRGTRKRRKQSTSATWTLPGGASIRIGTVGWVTSINVASPALNEAARGEAQYFDENDVPTPAPRTTDHQPHRTGAPRPLPRLPLTAARRQAEAPGR